MKLICPKISLSMELKKGKANVLALESSRIFEQVTLMLKEVLEKKSDEISLYDNEDRYDLIRYADVIFTPFDLTYEKREIQKKLFLSLQSVAESQDLLSSFAEINGKLLETLNVLNHQSDYQLEFEEDFVFSAVLKNYSVRMHDPKGSFAERSIEYMTNMQKLLSKNVFLFVNCNVYLTMNDYAYIETCASYYDLYILFICDQQIRLNHSSNEYIIDIDLCEIH